MPVLEWLTGLTSGLADHGALGVAQLVIGLVLAMAVVVISAAIPAHVIRVLAAVAEVALAVVLYAAMAHAVLSHVPALSALGLGGLGGFGGLGFGGGVAIR